jgi:hypothetical protein
MGYTKTKGRRLRALNLTSGKIEVEKRFGRAREGLLLLLFLLFLLLGCCAASASTFTGHLDQGTPVIDAYK